MLQIDPDAEEATLIAQIGEWETMKAAAAAAQAQATAQLVAKRRAAEAARGIPAAKRGRGLASEIALARRDSPACGGRHLGFATALVHEMPHTLAALESGVLSEWRATLIVRESACLDVDDRRLLDAELCADPATLEGKGNARIAADAKAIAYRLDPHAVVDRAARAETERCVTVRPAPDCMTYVTALLPMTQGVAVYAALKRAADTCFDGRSRGQVMADTLVERVTGRPADGAHPDRGQPGALRRHPDGRWDPGGGFRLRAGARGDRPPVGAAGADRSGVQGHPAQVVRITGDRGVGGHGVALAVVSERPGPVHRDARHSVAEPRTATPRSATSTTPPRMRAVERHRPPTGRVHARPATTPRRPTAGPWMWLRSNAAHTQRNSPPRPVRAIGRPRRRCCRASTGSRSVNSNSRPRWHCATCTPPERAQVTGNSASWVSRMLLPDGSRKPASIPYGASNGASVNSTPRAVNSS